MENWKDYLDPDILLTYAIEYGEALVFAIVIFFIGKWVARRVTNLAERMLKRSKLDQTLVNFVGHIVYAVLLVFVVVAAISQLGVETSSIAAAIAAAGLAIGLALQGSLSNFAAGFMIIGFRPFRAGDYVEAGGVSGTVEEVGIFYTVLKTPDNKKVILPNSNITDAAITNYSAYTTRRLDLMFGIGYDDDIAKAKSVLHQIIADDERILKDPEPVIGVHEHGDSSVNLVCRPWVKTVDYWAIYWDVMEKVKLRFDEEGISIPFPQRDVHLIGNAEAAQKVA